MNITSVRWISFFAGVAMVGLILIQYYWIGNAVKLREERFEQDVQDALTSFAGKIDKHQLAQRIKRRLEFRKQGIMQRNPVDTSQNGMPGNLNNNTHIQYFQQLNVDSNGINQTNMTTSADINDTAQTDINSLVNLPAGIGNMMPQQQVAVLSEKDNLEWVNKRTDMMNDIFDELVSVTIYHDYASVFAQTGLPMMVRTPVFLCTR